MCSLRHGTAAVILFVLTPCTSLHAQSVDLKFQRIKARHERARRDPTLGVLHRLNRTVPEALHLGVPVIGWDHGGVQETLAVLFPGGAVEPGNRGELLSRSREFLAQRPAVPRNGAFGLRESMENTFAVYESARMDKAP